jgi:hypothetical protein
MGSATISPRILEMFCSLTADKMRLTRSLQFCEQTFRSRFGAGESAH